MSACRHPAAALRIDSKTEHDWDNDGRSCSWITHTLACNECGDRKLLDSPGVHIHEYVRYTGRPETVEEIKSIRQSNPSLLGSISGIHPEVYRLALSNPDLEAKIDAVSAQIAHLKIEYVQLMEQYRGHLSPIDRVTLGR